MIKKEFEINDILNAVNRISKIERKKRDFLQTKKKLAERNDVLNSLIIYFSQSLGVNIKLKSLQVLKEVFTPV